MSTSPSPSSSQQDVAEEDDTAGDMPLTMAASVVLENLPRDAHKALETAGDIRPAKGTHTLAPILQHRHLTGCSHYSSLTPSEYAAATSATLQVFV